MEILASEIRIEAIRDRIRVRGQRDDQSVGLAIGRTADATPVVPSIA